MDLCPDHYNAPYEPKHGAYPCIRCFDEALARMERLEILVASNVVATECSEEDAALVRDCYRIHLSHQ